MDHIEAMLRLVLCRGIGPLRGKEIIGSCGDPAELFTLDARALQARYGLPAPLAGRLRDPALARAAQHELTEAARRGIALVPVGDPRYPPLLAHASAHPLILWVLGDLASQDVSALAVVGTRRASMYGRRQAVRLVRELAEYGITIVSGLARGIDGVAHQEALRAGTRTIAVLGSGLARIYPPEHDALAARISHAGAVVSEFPLFTAPRAPHFPRRNRIIAGLALGVLVIEGGLRSGTMITARHAAEEGRLVFAVPGPIDSGNASGVNELLRDGAVLTTSVEDILRELDAMEPRIRARRRTPALPPLTPWERVLLGAIPPGTVAPDAAASALGRPLSEVLPTITVLELKGYLHRSGKVLERLA